MIEIYDCTLREGEQAEGASFSRGDRIELCKRLDEFGVNFIELGWPLASKEVFDSFKEAMEVVNRAEIVAFGSTSIHKNVEEDENLNSIVLTGVKYVCIFGKTSLEHIEKQLRIDKQENLDKIEKSIKYLVEKGFKVFYDAEHYFDAYNDNKEYAIKTLVAALDGGASRLILCDTKGGVLPERVSEILKETSEELKDKVKREDFELGVHFHDDCALALANTLSSLDYVGQVQGTINGIGERVGNLNLSEFLPVYVSKMKNELNVDLKKLKKLNDFAFKISGLSAPEKRAFVGDSAFAHKAGVHIDALCKGACYEHADPEEFGNKRIVILNTLGGRSSVVNLAKQFGYELDKKDLEVREKIQELFYELGELEGEGYRLGMLKSEQFLLIDRYFGENEKIFEIKEWNVNSEMKYGKERSYFKVICELDKEIYEDSLSVEGGPVDAAFKTLRNIIGKKFSEIERLELVDFHVSIAVRRGEESAVRTEIFFKTNDEEFSTVGIDKNILGSSIEALEKGLRYFLIKFKKTEE